MQADKPTSPILAAVLMVGSMAFIGVTDNVVVLLAESMGLWQFHFVRTVLMLPLIVGLSLMGLGGLRPRRPGPVALRSLLVAVSMLFYFAALAIMPIAQALAGLFTSPIFVLLITALVMKQPIGPWRILAVLIGFCGILCVLQPTPSDFDYRTLLPVAGGFFYAISAVYTRSHCVEESTVSLLAGVALALGLAGALGVLVLAIGGAAGAEGFVTRGWVWDMRPAAPWVVAQAVGSTAGVFMLIKAYQVGETSYAAIFEYSVMIFGPLFAWYAFGQTVGIMQVIGIGLIVAAGGLLGWRSSRVMEEK